MFRRIWKSLQPGSQSFDLASWNELGRKVAQNNSSEIAAFHEGRKEEPSIMRDPRSQQMAEAVLAEIVRLNADGRASEARATFDPAHEPFIPELEKGGRGLGFCAILGQDEFLVQQGTHYTETTTWHIQGEQIAKADAVAGFAWSRNRQHFLVVQPDGMITVHDEYGAPPREQIPAVPGSAFVPIGLPDALREQYESPGEMAAYTHLAISDNGSKILLCDAERGVALLRKGKSEWNVELLFPSMELGLEDQMREEIEDVGEFQPFFDMIHAALSPDGRFAAVGTQAEGHYLIDLDTKDGPSLHAQLGHHSEYPHDACFSDDSGHVALNSCHFYHGATFAAEMSAVQGLTTPPYEEHPRLTALNSYLRVYASGFLPASMTGQESGAFLLAGSGFAACVTPEGKILWELAFGSSAGGVDVCPETGNVLIASYSGMLHLIDPMQRQDPCISSGYKAPRELRRWLFWDRLRHPLIW